MEFKNSFSFEKKHWRVDNDGFLRVTARVLEEGVFDYSADESPEGVNNHNGIVKHFIPVSEVSNEALNSLEGKFVIIGKHKHQSADGLTDVVGSIAGKPYLQGGAIYADMLISNTKVAKQIMDGSLCEVSSSYNADFEIAEGDWNGVPYDGVQHNFQFNHVLLLPSGRGRCGKNVRIVNSKQQGGNTMSEMLTLQFGNAKRSYNLKDADAEAMAMVQKDVEAFCAENEKVVKDLTEKLEVSNGKNEELQKAVDELQGKLDVFNSLEYQAELAKQASSYFENEKLVLDNEVSAEAREEVLKACEAEKTFAGRRKVLVASIMNSKKVDTSSWSDGAIEGSFATLIAHASEKKVEAPRMAMGGVKADNSKVEKVGDKAMRAIFGDAWKGAM